MRHFIRQLHFKGLNKRQAGRIAGRDIFILNSAVAGTPSSASQHVIAAAPEPETPQSHEHPAATTPKGSQEGVNEGASIWLLDKNQAARPGGFGQQIVPKTGANWRLHQALRLEPFKPLFGGRSCKRMRSNRGKDGCARRERGRPCHTHTPLQHCRTAAVGKASGCLQDFRDEGDGSSQARSPGSCQPGGRLCVPGLASR